MSEEIMIRHCSPTLAGMKTGNLFNTAYENEEELKAFIRHWNRVLGKKGVRILPLRCKDNSALIYVYRPLLLSRCFDDKTFCRLLEERGYSTEKRGTCIVHLIQRLKESKEFPHEIGLFLGYPPEDVCGFIENQACGCKCIGCWKVYGDEKSAQKLFARYKKCTEIYSQQWAKGKSIERLTVAV
ncbi:MAG: DUF3793 family protein [Clostridiales bacterium]|nr:DUF3793 family protein [Clostridiales bacterium]